MSLSKSDIMDFVNDALTESYSDGDGFDRIVQTVLNDLSNVNLLMASSDIEISNGDLSMDYPTGYKDLLGIRLTGDDDNIYEPLTPLLGGHQEYLACYGGSTSTGRPEYFSEWNEKFWLYRPPDDDYTATIEYFKYHAADGVDSIEFGDEFRNCANFGACYFAAMMRARERRIAVWGPAYAAEKEMRRLNMPKPPYITRSP